MWSVPPLQRKTTKALALPDDAVMEADAAPAEDAVMAEAVPAPEAMPTPRIRFVFRGTRP